MNSPLSQVDRAEDVQAQAELDRLLAYLKIPSAEGLESRLLARLHGGPAAIRHAAWSRGWAPAAIAASLFCVFAGGLLVVRETAATTRLQEAPSVTMAAQMPSSNMVRRADEATPAPLLARNSLDTAAARRKPSTQILAGRRRGRATTSSAAR